MSEGSAANLARERSRGTWSGGGICVGGGGHGSASGFRASGPHRSETKRGPWLNPARPQLGPPALHGHRFLENVFFFFLFLSSLVLCLRFPPPYNMFPSLVSLTSPRIASRPPPPISSLTHTHTHSHERPEPDPPTRTFSFLIPGTIDF